jgi:hypothetical protein
MDVVDSWYRGYGDFMAPGHGPSQGRVFAEGSVYTRKEFPKLDYMKSCKEVTGGGGGGGGGGGATLLSAGAAVTTDTRGNLGPPEVMTQAVPGTDWIKDRWQAASDMGGTAIPGEHWVVIDLGKKVKQNKKEMR